MTSYFPDPREMVPGDSYVSASYRRPDAFGRPTEPIDDLPPPALKFHAPAKTFAERRGLLPMRDHVAASGFSSPRLGGVCFPLPVLK